jgi:hypothetical protein
MKRERGSWQKEKDQRFKMQPARYCQERDLLVDLRPEFNQLKNGL